MLSAMRASVTRLANRYGIRSIPTMALLSHGKELARRAGAMSWLIVNPRPVPRPIAFVGAAVPAETHAAGQYLRFRAITIVGLRFARPVALPAMSIYFQDKTFNRLSETRNYGGTEICAPDETILLCDITCAVGDASDQSSSLICA